MFKLSMSFICNLHWQNIASILLSVENMFHSIDDVLHVKTWQLNICKEKEIKIRMIKLLNLINTNEYVFHTYL